MQTSDRLKASNEEGPVTTLNQCLDQASDLKLEGVKQALIRQQEQPAYQSLSFTERLFDLLQAEYSTRQNKLIKRLTCMAKLKYRSAFLEDLEYSPARNLDRSQILSLATNDYIERNQNIILTGATGTGKTHVACALGHRAIADGVQTYFIRIPKLLEEVRLVKADGSYLKWLRRLLKFKLLILDDFGSAPLKPSDLKELLEIIEDRVQVGSFIITSQLDVKDWHAYLAEHTLADAILDRLVHTSHRINLKGDSMRKTKNALGNPYTKE